MNCVPATYFQEEIFLRSRDRLFTSNVSTAWLLSGPLDIEALGGAIDDLLERHEALRTSLTSIDGEVLQVVHATSRPSVRIVDCSTTHGSSRRRALSALLAEEHVRPFDLTAEPLARFALLRLGRLHHVLLATVSHAIYDGWSEMVLWRDLSVLFAARLRLTPLTLPALRLQFGDLAAWERAPASPESLRYWSTRLQGASRLAGFPGSRPASRPRSVRTQAIPPVSAAQWRGLANTARREAATPMIALLAAYLAVIHHVTRKSDVLVGVIDAARDHEDIQPIVGYCANAVPVRVEVDGRMSYRALVRSVRDEISAAYERQVPIEHAMHAVPVPAAGPQPAIHEVLFNFASASERLLHPPRLRRFGHLEAHLWRPPRRRFRVDTVWHDASLVLVGLAAPGGELRGRFEHNPEVLSTDSARHVGLLLGRVLRYAAIMPTRPLAAVLEDHG